MKFIEATFPYWFWGLGFIGCALSIFVMYGEYREEIEDNGNPRLTDAEFISQVNRRSAHHG